MSGPLETAGTPFKARSPSAAGDRRTNAHERRVGAALRRFAQPRPVVERCELCSHDLAAEHPHLVEPATRRLLCACDACAILFDHDGEARYRRVPRDARRLADVDFTEREWNALEVPIGLAFFFHSSPLDRVVAIYPSPAGPTEGLVEPSAWESLRAGHPELRELRSDVEALLVHRIGDARECCLAPIDQCYALVGLVRSRWEGLSGGGALWREIALFFDALKVRGRAGASLTASHLTLAHPAADAGASR